MPEAGEERKRKAENADCSWQNLLSLLLFQFFRYSVPLPSRASRDLLTDWRETPDPFQEVTQWWRALSRLPRGGRPRLLS